MAADKRPGKQKSKKIEPPKATAEVETEEIFIESTTGKLFVVATPIGNSGDWTARAREILSTADLVAAEDTRLLKREMAKVKIQPKKVISHHEHKRRSFEPKGSLKLCSQVRALPLASDAGTPMVSDPGYRLLEEATKNNITIVPVPGPSSLTASAISFSNWRPHIFFRRLSPRSE